MSRSNEVTALETDTETPMSRRTVCRRIGASIALLGAPIMTLFTATPSTNNDPQQTVPEKKVKEKALESDVPVEINTLKDGTSIFGKKLLLTVMQFSAPDMKYPYSIERGKNGNIHIHVNDFTYENTNTLPMTSIRADSVIETMIFHPANEKTVAHVDCTAGALGNLPIDMNIIRKVVLALSNGEKRCCIQVESVLVCFERLPDADHQLAKK